MYLKVMNIYMIFITPKSIFIYYVFLYLNHVYKGFYLNTFFYILIRLCLKVNIKNEIHHFSK